MASDPQLPTESVSEESETAGRRDREALASQAAKNPLELVGTAEAGAAAGASPPESSAPTERERSGVPVWLFVLILLGACVALAWQFHVAAGLEDRIAGLEQELDAANRLVDAHQAHLSEIRGGVSDLSARMEGLRALVDQDPADGLGQGQPPPAR